MTLLAMRFHPLGETSYQKVAISDCSAVRVVLSILPIAFTKLRSAAYEGLDSRSGPPTLCFERSIANGVRFTQPGPPASGPSGGASNGGVNW